MVTATLTSNQQTTEQAEKNREIYSPIVELCLKNYTLF